MYLRSIKSISIFLLLLGLGACKTLKHSGKIKVMPGTWQATPINIDGDCTDWPSPYPNYDADAMVAYATSNDKENLYITMQTGDALTQIKILKQGMTVSIDTGGKKAPTFVISFPLQNDDDLSELFAQGQNGSSQHLSRQFNQKVQKSAEGANQFSLEGFQGCNGGYMVSQSIPCGVLVKVRIDEYKQLVWEAKVPFRALYGTEHITPAYSGKPISVCYSVKGFKAPSTKSNDATPMNSGNNMGAAGMNATGRLNSMPSGVTPAAANANPMQRLYESTKTWKHFAIAWQ